MNLLGEGRGLDVVKLLYKVDDRTETNELTPFERRGRMKAVGGTGDLLAGLIGGLLAQGMAAWPASRLGCAVLREAGNRATRKKGPGLLAEDVPVHIAHTLSDWTRSA